eukprot:CAMPEP_0204579652 /NCGR_PEP_ID=MMETSP0661-20131031/43610_1 /ASSEMBLY_ACC=CAM_ASM_000606 /TAXON_ID=109239 /ORGANISM="Alexandrium margalefi, Strain AMGDE01CS-322" /LENGTH=468 /DNA_ID=CAMNT_0051588689 /DNA_START=125 /DNA_END=1531 /DNA_ORIENTATION=+
MATLPSVRPQTVRSLPNYAVGKCLGRANGRTAAAQTFENSASLEPKAASSAVIPPASESDLESGTGLAHEEGEIALGKVLHLTLLQQPVVAHYGGVEPLLRGVYLPGEAVQGCLVECHIASRQVVHHLSGLRLPIVDTVPLLLHWLDVVTCVAGLELMPSRPVSAVAPLRQAIMDFGVEEAHGLLVCLCDPDKEGALHVFDCDAGSVLFRVVERVAPASEVLDHEVHGAVAMEGEERVRHILVEQQLPAVLAPGREVTDELALANRLRPSLEPRHELVNLRHHVDRAMGAIKELRQHVGPWVPHHGDDLVHAREPLPPVVAALLADHAQGQIVQHFPRRVHDEGAAAGPGDVHVVEEHRLVLPAIPPSPLGPVVLQPRCGLVALGCLLGRVGQIGEHLLCPVGRVLEAVVDATEPVKLLLELLLDRLGGDLRPWRRAATPEARCGTRTAQAEQRADQAACHHYAGSSG